MSKGLFQNTQTNLFVQPSDEQIEIIKEYHDLDKIRINAYAGTGKTTTLLSLISSYPQHRFLILSFNKSVQTELDHKLKKYNLSNAEAKTIHGLAYAHYARTKRGKFRVMDDKGFRDWIISQDFANDYPQAVFLSKLFEAYCRSSHTTINQDTVSDLLLSNRDLRKIMLFYYSTDKSNGTVRQDMPFKDYIKIMSPQIAETLKSLYERITDSTHTTHNHYLKIFQEFVLKTGGHFKYDAILLDEAQDANGIMLSIVENADVKKKVVVGDLHQSIYCWNGAINALANLNWNMFYLTRSYRFNNPEIIELANKFLSNIKGEKHLMQSANAHRTISGTAYITQTNAMLISFLLENDTPFKTTRSLDAIFEEMLIADKIVSYYNNGDSYQIKTLPYYIRTLVEAHNTLDSLLEFTNQYDYDMYTAVSVAKRIRSRTTVEDLLRKAKDLYSDKAELTITTAYTAKGLEWNEVILAEDFLDFVSIMNRSLEEDIFHNSKTEKDVVRTITKGIRKNQKAFSECLDLFNLQYVAVTRASNALRGLGLPQIVNNFESTLEAHASKYYAKLPS